MKEEKDDLVDTISYRSNVKFPVSVIFLGLVGVATWSFAEWQAHLEYDNERFAELREYIDRKAGDRYTSVEAAKHEESVKQRFIDVGKKNEAEHKSLQRQIDSIVKNYEEANRG